MEPWIRCPEAEESPPRERAASWLAMAGQCRDAVLRAETRREAASAEKKTAVEAHAAAKKPNTHLWGALETKRSAGAEKCRSGVSDHNTGQATAAACQATGTTTGEHVQYFRCCLNKGCNERQVGCWTGAPGFERVDHDPRCTG